MDNIIKLDSVDTYNKLFGLETKHPLVSVVDLSKATTWPESFTINYGVYALFLKDTKCGDIIYGRQPYDYQEGTIVSFAPGQVRRIEAGQASVTGPSTQAFTAFALEAAGTMQKMTPTRVRVGMVRVRAWVGT